MTALLFLVFAAGALAAAAAVTGHRGQVCVRGVGYVVPARVEADPALNKRANRLVASWCTAAAVLSAVPLPALAATDVGAGGLSTWKLAALAGYAFSVVCIGSYPFEKIKHLHSRP